MELGVNGEELKFLVFDRVLPSVIIGICGMKSLFMSLNLSKSCAEVHEIELPFLGKVGPNSCS